MKPRETSKPTPLRAIRLKCLDCMCGQWGEVRNCDIYTCSLWLYRLGKRPDAAMWQEWEKALKQEE
jgi:hypothetical protein